MTASGMKVKRADADTMRRLLQPWQTRAFSYYDLVPEVKYAAQFYSRALSVLRLYAAKRDEGDDVEEIEDPSDPAVQALERIQDPGGGRSNMLGNYGRLMFLVGEANLFVSIDEETEQEQWEMLSSDELRITSGGYQRIKAPSLQAELYHVPEDDDYEPVGDDTAVAYRLWRRHPRYSMLADSTMQGVLDVAEELVLLTMAVRARTKSRLAGSGILLVNGKISPPSLDSEGNDEDAGDDPFISDLTEAMTAAIADEGAASAIVPLVVRTDVDQLDNVMKHLQIVDPTQLYPETGLRVEAVRRLAIGLDMPPEILLGVGDVNHWGAWGIDEHAWKAHLQPVAQQLVDDLTSAYFQPALRQAGIQNWQDYVVSYDATRVINRPDRSKDAKDLYEARAIGKAALRDACGFDEEDAPTQEEWDEMVGVAIRDSSLAVYGIPQIRGTGLEPEAGAIEQPETTGDGESPADTKKGPPPAPNPDEEAPDQISASAITSELAARVLGASDLALIRTRELAGNRLRNLVRGNEKICALIADVPTRNVAATLGRERARELGAPGERDLVAGSEKLFTDTSRLWGIDEPTAARLSSLLAEHAARHLYDERPPPLPPAYRNYVAALG